MPVASLRQILSYDEERSPTLTVIGDISPQFLALSFFFCQAAIIDVEDVVASK